METVCQSLPSHILYHGSLLMCPFMCVSPSDALKAAIFGLFHGICHYGNAPVTFYNNTVYGFEYGIGSNETWQNWGVGVPVIADNEAFCGRFSLYVG